ncbi:unannotated protein [freshwater metagenome]|uniref:Unannotated protein n=1 Tax=freshwater metagenome TaxID=449393 RepID=A0A6J6UST6_9ZZZZ
MVINLPARFGIATGVVNFPTTTWSLRAMLVSHIGLGANDWLYTVLITFAIEIENPVHVAVVGYAECGHPLLARLANEFIQT